jgi:chemotaxis protein methyltransferase CheR
MNKADIVLTEELLDIFIEILTTYTGIVPRSAHRDGIKNFIEKKINDSSFSIEEYKKQLLTEKLVLAEFINQSTVNETYFFREEKQFAVLREKIFPLWKKNNPDKNIKMWSAACSYGEEAYSLGVMALDCGITPVVTASDINSEVLNHCKSGVFLGTSLRTVDGVQFQNLVLPYRRVDGRVAFSDDIKKHITTIQLNLLEIDSYKNEDILPKNQNIIFLRNVFIYFSLSLRAKILKAIAEKCLAEDGYLFVSMNEIAQLDSTIVPDSLEKNSEGNVFYFHKKCSNKGGKANG